MCGGGYGSAGILEDTGDIDWLKIATHVASCDTPHPSLDAYGDGEIEACLYLLDCVDGPAFESCPAGTTDANDPAFGITGCCQSGPHPHFEIENAHTCASSDSLLYLRLDQTTVSCNHYSYLAGL